MNNDFDFLNDTSNNIDAARNMDPFASGGGNSGGGFGGTVFDQQSDPFGQIRQPQQQQANPDAPPMNDWVELIFFWIPKQILKGLVSITIGAGITLKNCFTVISSKSGDSFMDMFKAMAISFGPLAIVSLVIMLMGQSTDTTLAFVGVTTLTGSILNIILCGAGFLTLRLVCYKTATMQDIDAHTEEEVNKDSGKIEELNEIVAMGDEYGQSFDDIMNDILAEDEGSDFSNDNNSDGFDFGSNDDFGSEDSFSFDNEPQGAPVGDINVTEADGAVITNKWLFEKFSPIFPAFNPKFAQTEEITPDSEEGRNIEAVIFKVFMDCYGTDENDLVNKKKIAIRSIENARMFTKIIVKKPVGTPKSTDVIEEYMLNYSEQIIPTVCEPAQLFNDPGKDKISVNVTLSGDEYRIIITKPNKDAILLGDVFIKPEVKDFMTTKKNTPLVLGVDDIGTPVLKEVSEKSQELYSGVIGGGAGSGKTWFISSLAAQLVAFNQPKDLQILLVDPKGDVLFNKLALMPHCVKLIQGDSAEKAKEFLEMMKTLTRTEAKRRQELFATKNCANIQAYRRKGGEMPIITVFIDEYITLKTAMEDYTKQYNKEEAIACKEEKRKFIKADFVKELDEIMKVAVTKLRSAGIYVYIIAHRFIGTVDKTTREHTSFRCALRSETLKEETFSTKELANFSKVLINAGDSAMKIGEQEVKSVKTLGVTVDDDDTLTLLENIAKAWYKMDVDMSKEIKYLGYTKDYKEVQEELGLEDRHIQKYIDFYGPKAKVNEVPIPGDDEDDKSADDIDFNNIVTEEDETEFETDDSGVGTEANKSKKDDLDFDIEDDEFSIDEDENKDEDIDDFVIDEEETENNNKKESNDDNVQLGDDEITFDI